MTADEISVSVGLSPDQAWKPNDFRGNTKAKHTNHGWVFKSKLSKESPLEDHIANFLGILRPVEARISKIAEKAEVEFSCAIYSESSPPLYFEKAVISKINALGASLDIDFYIMPAEDSVKEKS